MLELPDGVRHFHAVLDLDAQRALLADIRAVVAAAPLYVPAMPGTGKEMSVRMTNCGALGWVTDKTHGYRYQSTHPLTGAPWPPIPVRLADIWRKTAGDHAGEPDACIVNFYDVSAKMGLHQDRDEAHYDAPVVTVSLGDACLFRVGGVNRADPTRSFRVESGDVVVLGGESRLAFHGVDRIYANTSMLLKGPGRVSLTMRRAG